MNPFLEPTVATPESRADWRRPSRRPRRLGGTAKTPRPQLPGAGARPGLSGGRPRDAFNQAGRALRAVALIGSLLLPGLATAVDINAATPQQLQEIKGIGPKTASIIVEERERGGRFESITDVSERVKGIGPKKAASLQAAGLTVGSVVADAGKPADAGARGARRGR